MINHNARPESDAQTYLSPCVALLGPQPQALSPFCQDSVRAGSIFCAHMWSRMRYSAVQRSALPPHPTRPALEEVGEAGLETRLVWCDHTEGVSAHLAPCTQRAPRECEGYGSWLVWRLEVPLGWPGPRTPYSVEVRGEIAKRYSET
jgi:hypothetical protein